MARVIDIQPGAVIRGIDIDASALPTRHVRGRVLGISRPSQEQQVSMRPLTSTLGAAFSARGHGAAIDSSGNFDIPNAVPGRYMLTATSGNLTGRVNVEVADRDVNEVVVSLTPSLTLAGRVVIEREGAVSPDPVVTSLRVGLRTDPLLPYGPTYGGPVQPDGSFTLPSGTPLQVGDYRVTVTPILTAPTPPDSTPPVVPAALQNLYVKSIRMGDVDVLNDRLHLQRQPEEPLTIVIGTNPGKLSGRVVDNRQQPFASATLVLVHNDNLRYRVNEKTTTSDASGRFEFQNVPPGDYKLFAWEAIDRGEWQDPDFMLPFENRGVAVRIEEGKQASVEVTVTEK